MTKNTAATHTDPESIRILADAVRAKRPHRKRVPIADVRAAFREALPEHAHAPDARSRFADFVAVLPQVTPDIALPASASAWRNEPGNLRVPTFIAVNRSAPTNGAARDARAWLPATAFAADETDPERLRILRAIDDWLRTVPKDGPTLYVPLQERSLEILGDEKALDEHRRGTFLFGGRLPLETIGCFVPPLPVPFEVPAHPHPGGPVLLVENRASYASLATWNASTGTFAAVAHVGGGNEGALSRAESALDDLLARTDGGDLVYLGDIDARGLNIPAGVDARRRAAGASPLHPWAGAYRFLVRNAFY